MPNAGEMKTLTINDDTFEIVDQQARDDIESLRSTEIEEIVKGYVDTEILGGSW